MKKFIYGFVLGLLALFGTAAVADYTIKDGGGSTQTVLAFVCATTKICPAHVLIKSDGTEVAVGAGNSAATTDVALTVADPNVLAAINAPIPACSASPCTTVIGGVVLYQGTTALSTTNGIYSNLLFGNAVADTNSGNKSAATQRNVLATDQLALATWGHGATGAAAPSGATQIGTLQSGATGGLMKGQIVCDKFVTSGSVSSATDTLLVQGVASQTIYVCGALYNFGGSAAQSVYLENTASTNANCSSTKTQIAGLVTGNSSAPFSTGFQNALWAGLKNTSGNGLCLNSSGTGTVQVDVWYAQF